MQAAEEIFKEIKQAREESVFSKLFVRPADFIFQHTENSKEMVMFGDQYETYIETLPDDELEGDSLLEEVFFSNHCYWGKHYYYNSVDSSSIWSTPPTHVCHIKDRILSHPNIKGRLIDMRFKVPTIYRFHMDKPDNSDIYFRKRFDRSKVSSDFEEELFIELKDRYDVYYSKCDDPTGNPLHGIREDIWRSFAPCYRIYKFPRKQKQPVHIDDLPSGVDAATLPRVSFDTVKKAIRKLER